MSTDGITLLGDDNNNHHHHQEESLPLILSSNDGIVSRVYQSTNHYDDDGNHNDDHYHDTYHLTTDKRGNNSNNNNRNKRRKHHSPNDDDHYHHHNYYYNNNNTTDDENNNNNHLFYFQYDPYTNHNHHHTNNNNDEAPDIASSISTSSSTRFYYRKSVDRNSHTILDRLSTDEWISIILYCDRIDNLRLSETCRTLYILCTRDIVWKHLLQSKEEKLLLSKLKRDYQHLFPAFEFPEIRFVDFHNFHDHKRRYVALKRQVDQRLNKRLEYQSMQARFNSSSLFKKSCYNCTIHLVWLFLFLLLIAISVTCVLFALYLDELLPMYNNKGGSHEGSYKVLIYSPLGFLVAPFCILLSFLICLCMGWVPVLSDVLQKVYRKTDRSQKGKLDSVLEHFLLAKNRSANEKQTAIMKLARILPMQLFWFPTLLIMVGIKEFFFPKQMWTYFFIPVFVSMLAGVLDLPYQLYRMKRVRSMRSAHFLPLMFAIVNIVLVYGTLTCAILAISLRMDLIIPKTIPWTIIFIPSYIVMLLVWVNAGLGFLYLASLSDIGPLTIADCMTFRDCKLASTMVLGPMAVMSLMIIPIASSVALLGYRLDGSKMKFYWVFAPIYIGFTLNAIMLVIVYISMKIMSCTRKRRAAA